MVKLTKDALKVGLCSLFLLGFVGWSIFTAVWWPAEQGHSTFIAHPVDYVYVRTVTSSSAYKTLTLSFNETTTFTITKYDVQTITTGIAVPSTFAIENLPPPDHFTWAMPWWLIVLNMAAAIAGLCTFFWFLVELAS